MASVHEDHLGPNEVQRHFVPWTQECNSYWLLKADIKENHFNSLECAGAVLVLSEGILEQIALSLWGLIRQ